MVYDAVYVYLVAYFKQWYTSYEDENDKNSARLNTVILNKVKVKSTNHVAFPDRAQNNWGGATIRLGAVCVCDDAHDEIIKTIFSKEELNYDAIILQGEVESSDDS